MTCLESAPPIIELRQYLLHRGRRDELIELFDRELVETQEALGIRVVGQFRDVDRPNHFVWLRGFDDHATRRDSLAAFYGGPVWQKHGRAAAATMIDSDDVHQLKAIEGLTIRRPSDRDEPGDRGSVLIVVTHRRSADHDDLIRNELIPTVEAAGFQTVALYTTDPTENTYPALPVRPSNVLVWLGAGENLEALDAAADQVSIVRRELARHTSANGLHEMLIDVLRLEPTARSCLNGSVRLGSLDAVAERDVEASPTPTIRARPVRARSGKSARVPPHRRPLHAPAAPRLS
jgi:hypothetical protein